MNAVRTNSFRGRSECTHLAVDLEVNVPVDACHNGHESLVVVTVVHRRVAVEGSIVEVEAKDAKSGIVIAMATVNATFEKD